MQQLKTYLRQCRLYSSWLVDPLRDANCGNIAGVGCLAPLLGFLLATLPGGLVHAEQPVSFSREILPILSNKCFVCHGPDAEDGELRLDSFESATEDRGGYAAVDPSSPADSELLVRIHSLDDPMPPEDAEKKLTAAERKLLSDWVNQGGKFSKHWAFEPPRKLSPDPVGGRREPNMIDRFIAARLKEQGVEFAPEAKPETLARRAALTLTGLPPEPEQLRTYQLSKEPDRYKRLVNELMASSRFGEHQARYWLDAVRYGDTHGLHLDNRRGIFPYRDWVVWAFNSNLPLNDFVTWQLAGDLLPDPTLDQLVATGFVRMNPTTAEGGAIPKEFQAKNNFDRTENIGTVLLGMTLTCARCHTHKYDPITQEEYYRLFAFFNSTAESSMDGNKYTYEPTVKVPGDQQSWRAWRGLAKQRDELLEKTSAMIKSGRLAIKGHESEWNSATRQKRLELLADSQGWLASSVTHAGAQKLAAAMAELRKGFTTSLVARERDKPRTTQVLNRGEYDQPIGDPLRPGILSVMGDFPEDAPANRAGLAQWLTSRDHPLVARVLVNRIWQRVFGDALVRTPEDFGLQGEQPTHPRLLDWLAVELMDSGWDMKHMVRMMVNSRTFKQNSAWRAGVDDPENRLLARGPGYRLDAEVIRDIGLWASGLLDPHMGGEGVKPYQPSGMWKALAHPASNTKEYKRDSGEQIYRRSLYVYWKRTSPHPMMTLFDAPDRESSCVRRSRTSTALQSLGLLNETQRIEMGKKLAERMLKEHQTDEQRMGALFNLLACREPNKNEAEACFALVQSMRDRYKESPKDAQSLLAIGDAKPASDLDASELAAWTQVAVTLLASDLALLQY